MKIKFGAIALTVAASCALLMSGCSGCGGDTRNLANLSSNWYANTSYKKIQPTFTKDNPGFSEEIITYDVKHSDSAVKNSTYSVKYDDGTYKTTFYAVEFDKELYAHEDYINGFPEVNPIVYYYKTELYLPRVEFIFGNESAVFENETANSTVTECYFMSVEEHLRPLYSKQIIKSSSPNTYKADSLASCYKYYDLEYVNYYNFSGSAVKTIITDNQNGGKTTEKTVSGLNGSDNSLFDVASLNIAVRAMKLSGSLSQNISIYSPAGNVQNYNFAASGSLPDGTSATLPEEERAEIASELKKEQNKLYIPEYNSENKEIGLKTVAVSATLSAQLTGVSQTYWFTAIDNQRNNTGRATMVKMSTPVMYSNGKLNYVLKHVESTLWHS